MALYADLPARRTRQLLGDVLVVAWVLLWVAVARAVHAQVSALAGPGRTLEDAGRTLEGGLSDAGEAIGRAPVIGDELRAPFDTAGGAAATLAEAGIAVQDGVARTAVVAALAVAAWPVLVVAGAWVLHRWRGVRRAAAARRLLTAPGGTDLLALRALARVPLRDLAALGPDVASAWRRGDEDVVASLAALTAAEVGVRVPTPPR
ncbi:hypothetical protein [Cellulomonas carbonis]|nr:hypothetical protein [Cellulomonas carbonis]GGC16631.1 hypothetical protein GCM10010972_32430 [Cellulomonas carbonis]